MKPDTKTALRQRRVALVISHFSSALTLGAEISEISAEVALSFIAYVAQMEQGDDCHTGSELRELAGSAQDRGGIPRPTGEMLRSYALAWDIAPTYVRSGAR